MFFLRESISEAIFFQCLSIGALGERLLVLLPIMAYNIVDKKNWTQKKAKIRCKMETPWQKDDILQQNKKRQLCLKS